MTGKFADGAGDAIVMRKKKGIDFVQRLEERKDDIPAREFLVLGCEGRFGSHARVVLSKVGSLDKFGAG